MRLSPLQSFMTDVYSTISFCLRLSYKARQTVKLQDQQESNTHEIETKISGAPPHSKSIRSCPSHPCYSAPQIQY